MLSLQKASEPSNGFKKNVDDRRMLGFGEDEQSQRTRAFFERGNRSELDKMIKFFENGVPASLR